MVLVEGSSESVSSTDLETSDLGWFVGWVGEWSEWCGLAESPVGPMLVAEDLELSERVEEMGLRTKVTRGAGSPAAAQAMVFKLAASAARWRAVTAPHLVALVRAGARFENGALVEREPATAA
ncbi:hypothetical protein SAMN05216499_109238 [Actinacidiphila paucisporea]|uniref:Uncharacterized protein n=1 Tax=Actinacidiphila paucisporea TaxID=310782 RepID=A0A1M7HDF2_9ACTN|nr:hypothetical protein SAMN05216499_109238 [Actinacidiphila paucisporea]